MRSDGRRFTERQGEETLFGKIDFNEMFSSEREKNDPSIQSDLKRALEELGEHSETIAALTQKIDALTQRLERLERRLESNANASPNALSAVALDNGARRAVELSAGSHYVGIDIAEGRYEATIKKGRACLSQFGPNNEIVESYLFDSDGETGSTACRIELQEGDKIDLNKDMTLAYISEPIRRR